MSWNLRKRCMRLLVVAGACMVFGMPAWSAPSRSVNGLIVKLRDTETEPAHRAQAASVDAAHTRHAARAAKLRQVLDGVGMRSARLRGVGSGFHHVDIGRRMDADEAERLAETLRERPDVEWVVPNERERLLVTPSDPLFAADATGVGGQWWLFPAGGSNANDIEMRLRGVPDVQTAWSTERGKPGAVVAVLDTGVTAHPDLDAHVLPGRDFVSDVGRSGDGDGWDGDARDPGDGVTEADRTSNPEIDCDVTESSWHGTTIAGMVAGLVNNNSFGAAVSWDGRVVPVRVAGKCGADVDDIIDGMRWAAGLEVLDQNNVPLPPNQNPARIISISFGGTRACNQAYQTTIDELRAHGVVVVAAAGNENGAVVRPASCRGVLAVTALNRDGFKAHYANFGPAVGIATVGGDPRDLGAWGMVLGDAGLLALSNAGTQSPGAPTATRVAGTSFATPIVAGVVGLMLSVNPNLTVDQIIDGVKRSARPHVTSTLMGTCSAQNPGRCICTTSTCGAGILDAPQALAYAADPANYVAPPRTPVSIDNDDVRQAVALGPDIGPTSGGDDSGGGGGAMQPVWLALLLLAVAALSPPSRMRRPVARRR